MSYLSQTDPEIADIIEKERLRQTNGLELIASENIVSRAVLEAMGSIMTNKYAEATRENGTMVDANFMIWPRILPVTD